MGRKAEATRERILSAAGHLFRKHGFAGVSVKAVMEAAGLTHGGFYKHFDSKDALFTEVIGRPLGLVEQLRLAGDDPQGIRTVLAYYLEPSHRERIGAGCTMVANAQDLPRCSERARRAFGRAYAEAEAEFARVAGDADEGRRLLAMCVGAVTLARALGSHPAATDLLLACRRAALEVR